jgi:2-dehydro-3-deoxyphosphogluconate aldolase/(4S)-4-hydroxy-2-oxoglutarate aldolase
MDHSRAFTELLGSTPVIPVLTIEDAAHAVELARALAGGGLRLLEITLRTDAALAAIRRIADQVPEAVVGAGTVLDPAQLEDALKAGARFLVSPGSTDELLAAAAEGSVPLVPGCATASEAMRLRAAGWTFLKFFPAEPAGGIPYLKGLAEPLPEIRFCPTGGVNPGNARAYLGLKNVACVGGSWVAPKAMVEAGDWQGIKELATEAAALRSPAA